MLNYQAYALSNKSLMTGKKPDENAAGSGALNAGGVGHMNEQC